MSTVAFLAVVGLLLGLVGFVWLTVFLSRRSILDDAVDQVGTDDLMLLEAEVRRRLGEAATPHEVEQVLKPVTHGRPAAHA